MSKEMKMRKIDGDSLTPIAVFNRLVGERKCLLESSLKTSITGRYSFIGADPSTGYIGHGHQLREIDLLYPLLFITDNAYKTLPLALLEFQGEYSTNYPMLFTGVIIASAPMVIAYVFLQRYFVAGMTAGAVKG